MPRRCPAGQLDLTDGDSNDQPLHKNAYRELLFSDNQQEVNMGALQDTLVTTIGPGDGSRVDDARSPFRHRLPLAMRAVRHGSSVVSLRAAATPAT